MAEKTIVLSGDEIAINRLVEVIKRAAVAHGVSLTISDEQSPPVRSTTPLSEVLPENGRWQKFLKAAELERSVLQSLDSMNDHQKLLFRQMLRVADRNAVNRVRAEAGLPSIDARQSHFLKHRGR